MFRSTPVFVDHFCRLVCFVALSGILLFQSPGVSGQDRVAEPYGFAKVVDDAGWQVPRIPSGNLKERTERTRDGITFSETLYVPKKKTDLIAVIYYTDGKRNLFQMTKYLELQGFSVLEARGRIFAFRTDSLQYGTSKTAGRMYFGERIRFTYIDTDGDGKFETRELDEISSIPVWVRRLGSKE